MCLAVPGQVLSLEADDGPMPHGRVRFGAIERDIVFAYVPEVRVGDHVLVHVGFAISIIDEHEAARTLAYLDELEEPVRVTADEP